MHGVVRALLPGRQDDPRPEPSELPGNKAVGRNESNRRVQSKTEVVEDRWRTGPEKTVGGERERRRDTSVGPCGNVCSLGREPEPDRTKGGSRRIRRCRMQTPRHREFIISRGSGRANAEGRASSQRMAMKPV